VIGRHSDQVGDFPGFGFRTNGVRRKEKAADNTNGAENAEPIFDKPVQTLHVCDPTMNRRVGKGRVLKLVGNVPFGQDETSARNSHHALIRAATSRRRQIPSGMGYVQPDDDEVAVVDFPNVRATLAADTRRPACVRVWADAFDERHTLFLTIVRCRVNPVSLYFSAVATDKSQQAVCSQVARLLRQEREKRGLSMNIVAERAGLSQQMVSYVERQMRNPTLETLLRIAAAMEINLAELLGQALKQVSKVAPKRKI
jgi:DNA-binding phage protein